MYRTVSQYVWILFSPRMYNASSLIKEKNACPILGF
jgi:hypothetical protein